MPEGQRKLVRAARSGTVRAAGTDGGCGTTVRVYHPAVDADVRYCHMVTGSPGSYNIYAGRGVVEEAELGVMGSTGNVSARPGNDPTHLHFDPDRSGIVAGNAGVNGPYGMRGYNCRLNRTPIYASDWETQRRYAWQGIACDDF